MTKPQFFQSFKDQRKSSDLVDVASAYVTKKAVTASNVLAEHDANQGDAGLGVWGGMASQGVLAAEVLPMMIKMQGLTSRTLLRCTLQLDPHLRFSASKQLTAKALFYQQLSHHSAWRRTIPGSRCRKSSRRHK